MADGNLTHLYMSGKKAPFSKVSEETAFSCRYYRILHHRYLLPNLKEGDYFIVDTPGSAMVIPQTVDGRFAMVRQFRYIQQEWMVEFPCGGLEADESPAEAAAREGKEEAGATGGTLTKIGEFVPYNGIASELCYLFHIVDAELVDSAPEVDEQLELVLCTEAEIDKLIRQGSIRDGMTLAAWQLFKAKR